MRYSFAGVMFLVALSTFTGRADGHEDPPIKLTDAEVTELLIGKWAVEEGGEKDGFKLKGSMLYKKDGAFESKGTIESGEKVLKIDVSGTWKVSDGRIVTTVAKTNIPELIKEGLAFKDRVLMIDGDVLKYRTEDGKETTRKKVKE